MSYRLYSPEIAAQALQRIGLAQEPQKTTRMLRYMNQGTRSGPSAHPLGVPRGNWEFMAVVRGSIRPVYPHRVAVAGQSQRLWLMPPESTHSWSTPAGKSSEVFVFHFASIHPLLESSLPVSRVLSIPLAAAEVELLATIFAELRPHYQAPGLSSAVQFEAAMLRLCGLFLARNRDVSSLGTADTGAETILRAQQWHRAHLAKGVRVNDVAAALNISPGHLRRLFLWLRHESPKRVFMRTTIEEACRLMAQGTLSLKEVAVRCGFSGFSEFYRAFKNHTGQSPSAWRSNRLYGGLGLETCGRRSAPAFEPAPPRDRSFENAPGRSARAM